jgi:hypothetical protein
MKNNITFNPKRDLPYLAAIAQTILYTWAGVTLLGSWGWIPGAATGLLVSVTMAYASSQYTEVAKPRQPFVLWGMVFLGALSPVVIGTSMYLDLPAEIHPVWRGVVGAALGVIPDVSVFLTGFVAGKGLVAKEQPAAMVADKPAQVADKLPKPAAKVARNPVTDAQIQAWSVAHPDATIQEIADGCGISRQAMSKRLAKIYGTGIKVGEQVTPCHQQFTQK